MSPQQGELSLPLQRNLLPKSSESHSAALSRTLFLQFFQGGLGWCHEKSELVSLIKQSCSGNGPSCRSWLQCPFSCKGLVGRKGIFASELWPRADFFVVLFFAFGSWVFSTETQQVTSMSGNVRIFKNLLSKRYFKMHSCFKKWCHPLRVCFYNPLIMFVF